MNGSAHRQPLWLRCETKEFEHRAALTPTTAKKLIDAGFDITVERDPQRIFDDAEYEQCKMYRVGCTLVEHNSWPSAPRTTPIIGLKELPVGDSALPHTHIMFAHCYKDQGGWADVLKRFIDGPGTLYDLEFLQDASGRRVAAFGYHAGFAGAAVGLLALAEQAKGKGKRLGALKPYPNERGLVDQAAQALKSTEAILGRRVRALVIGALGRCGRGAVEFFQKAGLRDEDIIKWDMAETKKGGPFEELLEVDVFVNCIYLTAKIPSFLTAEFVNQAGASRNLAVICDVSCDTTNPNNPIPVYTVNTTFDKPTVDVPTRAGPELTVVSIDHLPTLLPREASEAFSTDLLPSLKELPSRQSSRVWLEAEKLYTEHSGRASAHLQL